VRSNPAHGEVYNIYVINVFFSGHSGFLHKKTDCHDKTEILLKVALNTMKSLKSIWYMICVEGNID
jgi:hypothetical protein